MPAKKRAVAFDFDGVIADSFTLHLACWQQVLADYGAAAEEEAIVKSIGWTALDTARVLVKEAKVAAEPTEVAKQKSVLFSKRAETELKPMTGALDAVRRLGEQSAVAVTSGLPAAPVKAALEGFGIAGTFDLVITSDDLEPEDEIDDLLKLAIERFGIKPSAGVVVDDSRNGLLAAERAGMKSIAFDSNPKFALDHSMADAVVGSLDELQPELLDSVFSTR